MPRAANASLFESASLIAPATSDLPTRLGLPPARRLRTPAQFAAVAGREGRAAGSTWRGGGRYLAMQARIVPMADLAAVPEADVARAARVRFGMTVGKRNARRAVERALVKRVLREAARQAAPALDDAAGPRAVDVVLRLRVPCPPKAQVPHPEFKRQLRDEADALLAQLAAVLRRADSGGAAP